MRLAFKPRGRHFALAVFLLGTIVCGTGWRYSLRETARIREMNRDRSARERVLEGELGKLRRENDDARDAAEKVIADLEHQIACLTDARARMRAELDERAGGFAFPKGIISWIDPVGKKVWLDLGKADGLASRTTFNVLKGARTRVVDGIVEFGVGDLDVKGSIEVTRILEDHLAEARILNEALDTPIAKGDALYSPTWHRRQGEAYSLVGLMDIDGDGNSDFDLLGRVIAFTGGRIDNEVDETGALRVDGEVPDDGKPQITSATKFVVIGQIPGVEVDDDPQAVEKVQRILAARKQLEEAAREQGVRVISLGDFLQYLGFNPHARRPAERRVLTNPKLFRNR
jgi:hypothetical protein